MEPHINLTNDIALKIGRSWVKVVRQNYITSNKYVYVYFVT